MKRLLLLLPVLAVLAMLGGCQPKADATRRPPDSPPIAPPGQPVEPTSPGIPKMPGQ